MNHEAGPSSSLSSGCLATLEPRQQPITPTNSGRHVTYFWIMSVIERAALGLRMFAVVYNDEHRYESPVQTMKR